MQFDQHFMKEGTILNTIVSSADITSSDTILEVGSGPGYLTHHILKKKPCKLTSVEIDPQFEEELCKIQEQHNTFSYAIGNILEVDFTPYSKIVANIPYTLTEPLYTKFLEDEVPFVVLLQGKKFYTQVMSGDSIWSHFVQAFYDVELVEEISGNMFEPVTKVTSAIVKLTQKEERSQEEELMWNLFLKRKRRVVNAVVFSFVDTLGVSKKEAKKKLKEMGLTFEEKVLETLSREEFQELIKNCAQVLL